jgi:hypothetical protein
VTVLPPVLVLPRLRQLLQEVGARHLDLEGAPRVQPVAAQPAVDDQHVYARTAPPAAERVAHLLADDVALQVAVLGPQELDELPGRPLLLSLGLLAHHVR